MIYVKLWIKPWIKFWGGLFIFLSQILLIIAEWCWFFVPRDTCLSVKSSVVTSKSKKNITPIMLHLVIIVLTYQIVRCIWPFFSTHKKFFMCSLREVWAISIFIKFKCVFLWFCLCFCVSVFLSVTVFLPDGFSLCYRFSPRRIVRLPWNLGCRLFGI